MHGCASGSLVLVNAGVDSMGGLIDGGVEISSAPSLQQSSDLEKTQAELRETFTAAEKFRRELEFLQKGGDPLDLKVGTAATVSLQSTSLTDQHPEQIVTSEVKGSFAITASPHGDSVESSGRLGAPSAGEPNSADNLMLFEVEKRSLHFHKNNSTSENHAKLDVKESGESVALELPKKSYKRRIRSRPNRDGPRSSSTDAGPRSGQLSFPSRHAGRDAENQEQKYLKTKNPNFNKNLSFNSRVDVKLSGTQLEKSTPDLSNGQVSRASDADLFDQSLTCDNTRETPGSSGQENLSGFENPMNVDAQTVGNSNLLGQKNVSGNTVEKEIKSNDCNGGGLTKEFDSKSSCSRKDKSLDCKNKNESLISIRNVVNSNGTVECNLSSNDLIIVKDDKILGIGYDNSNENGPTPMEEGCFKESEHVSVEVERKPNVGPAPTSRSIDICIDKPLGSVDCAEQDVFSNDNLKMATKEHEDSILEKARIIKEKRNRIAGLSAGIFSSESRHKSHWHFVLEEMSWLANDFAQERLWKVTAAAQISRNAAYSSRARFQEQNSTWKQKKVAHTLAEAVMEFWHTVQVKSQGSELEGRKKDTTFGLHQYGMRFLEYNNTQYNISSAQAPVTPDRISDLGSIDISWEDNLTEENLFYTVPPGAIEAYRKSIESHLLQCERTGSSMQEEVDAFGYDAIADNNTLEEDEGETSTYYLPVAFEGSRLPKPTQKKRKQFRSHEEKRLYEVGPMSSSFIQSFERNIGNQQSAVLSGKRPAATNNNTINVSIPTKRVRTTTSRQRFSGFIQANRADASSGDNNSFQDEQSGSHMQNNMEADSVGDYEKQWQYDMADVSNRPRKKKKGKHPGSNYEQRWQLDSNGQKDQKDHSKRRLENRQFDSNVAPHTSNMSSPNKFMKLLVRDRGKKAKSLKTATDQQDSGSPWSLFEDQALVVLVHDMGANWELISDAMNSTLQFKCISRNSKECKERHKILMDRNTGDGADSAEDSGSSQHYKSTLPGIPEGSARQLFQRLQGPMEENTLKSHFENIIMISQKKIYRKTQNDNQDPKQLQPPHASHALALSQVCPNNLSGGPVLTPLDLCEIIASSPEFLPIGYQGQPHSGGLPLPNHGNLAPTVPGSSSMVHGSHLASASAPLSPSVRDGRYGGSLSIEEQHRMQQYNQMFSARNMQQQQPTGSVSHSRPARMFPGGITPIRMPRPGFQGNSVRPHTTRPNQNTDHHQRQIMAPDLPVGPTSGTAQGVPSYTTGMNSFPNPNTHPTVQSHPLHQQQQQTHPSYGMRFMKERQLQQQRLLQQQFASTNPMMPPVQPQTQTQSQLPVSVSSPQSSTQSSPQKIAGPAPSGMLRNSLTSGNLAAVKQRPRQQPPPPPGATRLHPSVMKGGSSSPRLNGLSGTQPVTNSLLKRFPQKTALVGPSSLNNHHHHRQPQPLQKAVVVNQTQRTVQNRNANSSDPITSKVNEGSESDQKSADPFCEPGMVSPEMSPPPQSSGEPAVDHGGGGVHKQSSSSDGLTNSVGLDSGVQWQHQPTS